MCERHASDRSSQLKKMFKKTTSKMIPRKFNG